MDCCGSSKPKENDKDVKVGHTDLENNLPEGEDGKVVKAGHMNHENNQTEKEQTHGGGCCGGSGTGMWLHFIIMLIVFIALWYFSKK